MRPLHPGVVPLQRLFRRCGEHGEQAHGVGAVALDKLLRVDRVTLGLGHFRAVLEHHPLGQQVGEGLVGFHQPLIAQQLVIETRVEQVQDRVLDAADVLIHR